MAKKNLMTLSLAVLFILGGATPNSGFISRPIGIVAATTPVTLDVVPGYLANLFRGTGDSFRDNQGAGYLQVDDSWCSQPRKVVQKPPVLSLPNFQDIKIPAPIWQVSSVGTAAIPVAFDSQLLSNGAVLQTANTPAREAVIALNPGRNASNEIKVDVHNALRVRAEFFSFVREGSDNVYPRRKLRFELLNPSGQVINSLVAGIGYDSNETVGGRDGRARGTGYILQASAPLGGDNACSRWRVRVSDAETGAVPNPDPSSKPIYGGVRFFLVPDSVSAVNLPPPPKFGIVQSDTVEKDISINFSGEIKVQANWDTDEFTLDNYRLKFSLVNTHGSVVASNTGYSRDSFIIGVSDSQRMKIDYSTKCSDFGGSQHWKIRVEGASQGKVKNVVIMASLSPQLYMDAIY